MCSVRSEPGSTVPLHIISSRCVVWFHSCESVMLVLGQFPSLFTKHSVLCLECNMEKRQGGWYQTTRMANSFCIPQGTTAQKVWNSEGSEHFNSDWALKFFSLLPSPKSCMVFYHCVALLNEPQLSLFGFRSSLTSISGASQEEVGRTIAAKHKAMELSSETICTLPVVNEVQFIIWKRNRQVFRQQSQDESLVRLWFSWLFQCLMPLARLSSI